LEYPVLKFFEKLAIGHEENTKKTYRHTRTGPEYIADESWCKNKEKTGKYYITTSALYSSLLSQLSDNMPGNIRRTFVSRSSLVRV